MIERFKLESLEIKTIETNWLFGFVCEITFNINVNGKLFIYEKNAMNVQFKNPEKELKKDLLSGTEIQCLYNGENVKIRYEDGWIIISKI